MIQYLYPRRANSKSMNTLYVIFPGAGSSARRSDVRVEKQLEDRSREVKDLVGRLDKALKEKETMK